MSMTPQQPETSTDKSSRATGSITSKVSEALALSRRIGSLTEIQKQYPLFICTQLLDSSDRLAELLTEIMPELSRMENCCGSDANREKYGRLPALLRKF
jgi:hypothetical protein